jgi:phosphoribosyl 1,2-cyclic phosphodiesterase
VDRILKALDYNADNVLGCLITHEHNDHKKAAADLVHYGIHAYASYATLCAAGLEGNMSAHALISDTECYIRKYNERPQIKVTAFRAEHDAAEPFVYLIDYAGERVLYATDTYFMRYSFRNVHHYIVECNYMDEILEENLASGSINGRQYERLQKSHLSLKRLCKFLRACDMPSARTVVLVHMSDRNSNERQMVDNVRTITNTATYAAHAGDEIIMDYSF